MKLFVSIFIVASFFTSLLIFAGEKPNYSKNDLRQEEKKVEEKKVEEEEMLEPEEETKPTEIKQEKEVAKPEEKKVEPTIEEPSMEEPEEDVFKEEEESSVPENLRYYKEKYEFQYEASFEKVWNVLQKALLETSCMIETKKFNQTDDGLYRGTMKSDFCVFSQGFDSTFTVLKKYSLEVPIIRGGAWMTGRLQYKFIVQEKADGTVKITLTTEMSGYEEHVTMEVHFWKSNGILENRIMMLIDKLMKE